MKLRGIAKAYESSGDGELFEGHLAGLEQAIGILEKGDW